LDDEYCLGTALGNVGVARARLGHTAPAFRILRAALRVRRRTHNRWEEAATLNELGAVLRELGRWSEAVAHHQQALVIAQTAGFRQEECAIYVEFGHTLQAAGDLIGALRMHGQALDAASKLGHRYHEARARDGIAACLRDTDPEAARRHWLSALRLYRELEVPESQEVGRQLAALRPVSVSGAATHAPDLP
jgi:tetratricopeptide (TPR) repeat protein